ncbi:class I SAM-dependent methyltransferase [Glaciimonas immobilis]|uniref:SAM-dependent methyltransferase n=1 Tax=Glaciimonas immobilis TaxID=728004 RepID=A0A840RT23_9BURK|nr:class I SAM-dependent methyltransferase [Glaciimonas immobilis]KAF3996840.1 class I SAM-dependent methyltransferase [Glaciimonas immobilis]MBB5199609.1 SAM-dependent methyltransferase [Glaciimonas immobilis]
MSIQNNFTELAVFYDTIYTGLKGSKVFQEILQDVFVEDYFPDLENFSFIRRSDVHKLKESLSSLRLRSTILELGCGTGGLLHYLSKDRLGLAIGIDISPCAVAYATQIPTSGSERIFFAVADMTELPFSSNSIDAILSIDAIHHSRPFTATAAEIARVLQPDGRLIFTHWTDRKALRFPALDPLYLALLKNGLEIEHLYEADPGIFMQLKVYAAIHDNRARVTAELGREIYGFLMNEARAMWHHAGNVSRIIATFSKPSVAGY